MTIDYHVSWDQVRFCFQLKGSVFPFASFVAIPCALLSMALKLWDDSTQTDNLFHEFLRNAFILEPLSQTAAFGGFSFLVGFIIVFRTSQSYGRYMDCLRFTHSMLQEWFDAASSLVAFCKHSQKAVEEVDKFSHTAIRLISMLSATALAELTDEEGLVDYEAAHKFEPGEMGIIHDTDKSNSFVQEVNADGPAHKKGIKKGNQILKVNDMAFPIEDAHALNNAQKSGFGYKVTVADVFKGFETINAVGLDWESYKILGKCKNKPHLAYQWIQQLIVENLKNGLLEMPAPVLGRVYQELGTGMARFQDAHVTSKFAFPFPYAQTTVTLLLMHWILCPMVMAQWTNHAWAAAVFTHFQVFILWSLNAIATGIECPFGGQENDIDLYLLQQSFNGQLLLLLNPRSFGALPTLAETTTPQYRCLLEAFTLERKSKGKLLNEQKERRSRYSAWRTCHWLLQFPLFRCCRCRATGEPDADIPDAPGPGYNPRASRVDAGGLPDDVIMKTAPSDPARKEPGKIKKSSTDMKSESLGQLSYPEPLAATTTSVATQRQSVEISSERFEEEQSEGSCITVQDSPYQALAVVEKQSLSKEHSDDIPGIVTAPLPENSSRSDSKSIASGPQGVEDGSIAKKDDGEVFDKQLFTRIGTHIELKSSRSIKSELLPHDTTDLSEQNYMAGDLGHGDCDMPLRVLSDTPLRVESAVLPHVIPHVKNDSMKHTNSRDVLQEKDPSPAALVTSTADASPASREVLRVAGAAESSPSCISMRDVVNPAAPQMSPGSSAMRSPHHNFGVTVSMPVQISNAVASDRPMTANISEVVAPDRAITVDLSEAAAPDRPMNAIISNANNCDRPGTAPADSGQTQDDEVQPELGKESSMFTQTEESALNTADELDGHELKRTETDQLEEALVDGAGFFKAA